MTPFDTVIRALDDRDCSPRGTSTTQSARCPSHDDRNASLSIGVGRDGRALVHCHAGCAVPDILDALGLEFANLFDGSVPKPWSNDGLRRSRATVRRDGRVQLGGVAYMPGADNGEKSRAARGVPRDLWPAPEDVDGDVLLVVEGEPDAQTAIELRLPATDVPGAAKWTASFAERIASGRRRVVVVADSDTPGREAAAKWAADVAEHCADVRLLDFYPDRDDGSDLSTFAADAVTEDDRAQARELIVAAASSAQTIRLTTRDVLPSPSLTFPLLNVAALAQLPPPRYLIDDTLTDGLSALYGPSGTGKSFLAIDFACSIATGHDWHGHTTTPGTVVYIAAEGARGLLKRLRAWEIEHARQLPLDRLLFVPEPINLLDSDNVHKANRTLTSLASVDLIIVDTFARSMAGGEENSARDVGLVISRLDQLRAIHGSAALLIHHTGKDPDRGERGSSALRGAADELLAIAGTHEHLRLTCSKRKDDAEFQERALHLAPVADSLVIRDGRGGETAPASTFRPTVLMERLSRSIEETPGLSKRALRQAVPGNNDAKDLGLELLIVEGFVRVVQDGQARQHHSMLPFREHDAPTDRAPVPEPCPDRAPGTVENHRAPVPTPLRARGTGHGRHGGAA